MKYEFDSYLLYEVTPQVAYTVKVKIQLKESVDAEILRRAAEMAFRRFWYFSKTVRLNSDDAFVLENTGLPILAVLTRVWKKFTITVVVLFVF